jgi:hypothetical protein
LRGRFELYPEALHETVKMRPRSGPHAQRVT